MICYITIKKKLIYIGKLVWKSLLPLNALFNRSVMFDSSWPPGQEHASHSCPSSPEACSNSCSLNSWCHPTNSFSIVPFSCLQSFPHWGSFLMSQLFSLGVQSIGASASVFPMNIQEWSPLGLTALISLQCKGLSRVFSNTTVEKHQLFGAQPLYGPTLTSIHDY